MGKLLNQRLRERWALLVTTIPNHSALGLASGSTSISTVSPALRIEPSLAFLPLILAPTATLPTLGPTA